MGDGGMMVCNNTETAAKLRLLASHGMQPRYYHKLVGINSRLDTIQAAILNVKIAHLQSYSEARRAHANRYTELFAKEGLNNWFELPHRAPEATHVWNQYGIRVPDGLRDPLRKHLTEMGIGNEVYYPVPLHLQECFHDLGYTQGSLPKTERAANEILNLPVYPELTEKEQVSVVAGIKRFYSSATLRRACLGCHTRQTQLTSRNLRSKSSAFDLLLSTIDSVAFLRESHRFNLWKFRFSTNKSPLRDCRWAAGFAFGKSGGPANEEGVQGLAENLTIRRTSLRDCVST